MSPSSRPLPRARLALLLLLALTSLVTLGMSAWVLQYSLKYTQTYLKSNPEVLFASAFNFVCVGVALTIGRHTFFTQIWCEVAWMGVSWFLYLGGVSTLNTQTPGLLLSPCTTYFLCRGLLVMWIFGLLSLLAMSLILFVTLGLALWQTIQRKGHGRGVWTSRVESWEGWNGTWTWEGRRERRHTSGAMSITCAGPKGGPPQLPETPTHVLEDDEAKPEGASRGFGEGIPHLRLEDDEGHEKRLSTSAYGTPYTPQEHNPFADERV